MAYWKFTASILAGRPIDVYAQGQQERDFTFVEDVVEAVVRLVNHPATPNPAWTGAHPDTSTSRAPYRVYNLGNHQPVPLLEFIRTIESAVEKKAELNFLPAQAGDVPATCADVEPLRHAIGYSPATTIQEGIPRFVEWYRETGHRFA